MHVTINTTKHSRPEARTGFFSAFKTPTMIDEFRVSVIVELSEEERAILTQYNLWDYTVLEVPFQIPPDILAKNPILASQVGKTNEFSIRNIVQGYDGQAFGRNFRNPVDAAKFRLQLENETLPKLKSYLVTTKDASSVSSKTFDL
jgi:hypothetical protein